MTQFYKYHGAGNDFIMIDNREGVFDYSNIEENAMLCHRRYGIGADGIITLEHDDQYDFRMVYINSDGKEGSMCGNGGRCIVKFAYDLGIIKDKENIRFIACDGVHEASIQDDDNIKLKMIDMKDMSYVDIKINNEEIKLPFIHCGTTPHVVYFVNDLEGYDVYNIGKHIRHSLEGGTNVNFVEIKDGIFHVRTFERGVEDETYACGTGACSVAVVSHILGYLTENTCTIKMPGGILKVEFDTPIGNIYKNIFLTGPAVKVFKGEIN